MLGHGGRRWGHRALGWRAWVMPFILPVRMCPRIRSRATVDRCFRLQHLQSKSALPCSCLVMRGLRSELGGVHDFRADWAQLSFRPISFTARDHFAHERIHPSWHCDSTTPTFQHDASAQWLVGAQQAEDGARPAHLRLLQCHHQPSPLLPHPDPQGTTAVYCSVDRNTGFNQHIGRPISETAPRRWRQQQPSQTPQGSLAPALVGHPPRWQQWPLSRSRCLGKASRVSEAA